ASTVRAASCATSCTKKEPRPMRCDEVAALLPSLVDGVDETNLAAERHVQRCLRCQTDLVRYRKLVRNLELLRTRYIEPNPPLRRPRTRYTGPIPGLLAEPLAALSDAAERGAVRTLVPSRRLAYAGAIGGTVATAATALLIARSRRRGALRVLAS